MQRTRQAPGSERAVDELRDSLRKLLEEREAEIIERGTDWVVENAVDLRGARPREETRRLVASVVEFNRELIIGSPAGSAKRDAFIDFVTSYRAALDFSVSTLLRGFLSFRQGLLRVLDAQGADTDTELAVVKLIDELYFDSIFEMSDVYMNKLKDLMEERQAQLRERDLQVARLERSMAESLLKRFLAPAIVDEIISGQRSIDQEPKSTFCTIMFADLVGFTRLTQTLDARRLGELLNQYLATMSEVVFFHRGTIDKFIGDTVMALFGTPLPMDDKEQAEYAVRCAVDMQRALIELDESPATRGLPPLAMRIGLDCGNVLVGSLGSSYRSDFTAIGMHVNRARRIQEICQPGEIYLTSDVAQRVPSSMVEPVGSLRLEGIIGGVLCYRVVASRAP
jgi:class 3 adenylate cyclase